GLYYNYALLLRVGAQQPLSWPGTADLWLREAPGNGQRGTGRAATGAGSRCRGRTCNKATLQDQADHRGVGSAAPARPSIETDCVAADVLPGAGGIDHSAAATSLVPGQTARSNHRQGTGAGPQRPATSDAGTGESVDSHG